MPFGIRPSNVRVCHSTTRALLVRASKLSAVHGGWQVSFLFLLMLVLVIVIEIQEQVSTKRTIVTEIVNSV
jgi:hypothetical protein